MRIGFWNARSLGSKLVEVRGYVFANNNNSLHPNKKGGLGILVKESIEFLEILDLPTIRVNSLDYIGIRIRIRNKWIRLFTIYRKDPTNFQAGLYNEIFEIINPEDNTIIIGDFNAKNKAWNCMRNDLPGKDLRCTLIEYGMTQARCGNH